MSNATNLAAVFDEHPRDEFELHDASATMTTMCERPHLHHLPTMAGGNGGDEVFRFYPDHFVTKWPHDTLTTYVSRAIGDDQLVYWDQACVLVQVGLLDRAHLPGSDVEQAQNLLTGSYATNPFLYRERTLSSG
ncbi:MAG: hypothetical protein WA431_06700 [Candidatus Cybelea sp.]